MPSLGLFLLRIPSQKALGTERVITRMSSPMVCLRMLDIPGMSRDVTEERGGQEATCSSLGMG